MKSPTTRHTAQLLACTFGLIAMFLLSGCGGNESSSASNNPDSPQLTKLIVQTDWYAQPEHGGVYQAKAKGFYKELGIDVEIREGANMNTVPQLVAAGKVDIAMTRSDSIIVAASRGIPLLIVGAHMQHDPQGIIFHEESGIQSFKDLAGRDVMIAPGGAMIDIIKRVYNIDFNLIPMDWGLTQFLKDKEFVQQCFITSEPYYVKKQGANPKTILISETGFDPYRVWYTNKKFAAKNPELLKNFLQATTRGWQSFFSEEYPEALTEISNRNPKITRDFALWTIQVMKDNKLVEGFLEKGEGIGLLNKERLQKNIDTLDEIGLLEKPMKVDDVMTDQFLPTL